MTGPELTLLHLANVCHPSTVELAFDAAERRELVTRSSKETLVLQVIRRNGLPTPVT